MLRIHPRYLSDSRLLALWRESLKGQGRLCSGTDWKGFSQSAEPLKCVGAYLSFIASEGLSRGYKMNHELILIPNFDEEQLTVSYELLRQEADDLSLAADAVLRANPVFGVEYQR